MRIAFVASNPSHLGPNSPAKQIFWRWVNLLNAKDFKFFNVANLVTENNRPLKKSEYELDRLQSDLCGVERVVALGNTAEDALKKLGIIYFKLPHPSPRNRLLNDRESIDSLLYKCKMYLEERC